ncbi:MAG: hypothetical protein AAF718_17505 [Pseudomonadota bacterium]
MAARRLALLAIFATPAWADYDPTQYPAYETCALCHGLFGVSHTGKFPNLGGQKQEYIEGQIHAFLNGERQNDGGQMQTIVTELQPEDIPFVAEWFASQDPPQPYETDDTSLGEASFAELGCVSCHSNTADGGTAVPYLSAQKPDYLRKQMSDFRDGNRNPRSLEGMHQNLLSIPDDRIDAIATYLAAKARP